MFIAYYDLVCYKIESTILLMIMLLMMNVSKIATSIFRAFSVQVPWAIVQRVCS